MDTGTDIHLLWQVSLLTAKSQCSAFIIVFNRFLVIYNIAVFSYCVSYWNARRYFACVLVTSKIQLDTQIEWDYGIFMWFCVRKRLSTLGFILAITFMKAFSKHVSNHWCKIEFCFATCTTAIIFIITRCVDSLMVFVVSLTKLEMRERQLLKQDHKQS